MDHPDESPSGFDDPIIRWLLGFFGAALGILILPKALKYLFRKLVFGTVIEIAGVLLAGLLTQKAVELLSDDALDHDHP